MMRLRRSSQFGAVQKLEAGSLLLGWTPPAMVGPSVLSKFSLGGTPSFASGDFLFPLSFHLPPLFSPCP